MGYVTPSKGTCQPQGRGLYLVLVIPSRCCLKDRKVVLIRNSANILPRSKKDSGIYFLDAPIKAFSRFFMSEFSEPHAGIYAAASFLI